MKWLESIKVNAVPQGSRKSVEPFIRPFQGNGSVYFKDPNGNSLELMCYVEVPDSLQVNAFHIILLSIYTTPSLVSLN